MKEERQRDLFKAWNGILKDKRKEERKKLKQETVEKPPLFTAEVIENLGYNGKVEKIFSRRKPRPILSEVEEILKRKDLNKKGVLIKKQDELVGIAVLVSVSDLSDNFEECNLPGFTDDKTWEFKLICTNYLFDEMQEVKNGPVSDCGKISNMIVSLAEELAQHSDVRCIVADKKGPGSKFHEPFLHQLTTDNSEAFLVEFPDYLTVNF